MLSAFGIEHFSKSASKSALDKTTRVVDNGVNNVIDDKGHLRDSVAPLAPRSTAEVYNNTREGKKKAAAANWGARIAGGAVGSAAGYGAFRLARGNVKSLKTATKYGSKGKELSAEKKQSLLLATLASAGSTAGGYAGGRAHKEHIKRTPKYRYKE